MPKTLPISNVALKLCITFLVVVRLKLLSCPLLAPSTQFSNLLIFFLDYVVLFFNLTFQILYLLIKLLNNLSLTLDDGLSFLVVSV